nr:hypothetical protein CFP56_50151 [Quercus suber]
MALPLPSPLTQCSQSLCENSFGQAPRRSTSNPMDVFYRGVETETLTDIAEVEMEYKYEELAKALENFGNSDYRALLKLYLLSSIEFVDFQFFYFQVFTTKTSVIRRSSVQSFVLNTTQM